jgi:phage shock protein PspC (stress-responsive transcriptional regulator)
MKKTIKISLQGTVFFIDEDAYSELQQYLTDISNRFSSKEEREEILQDIETRIAEIFTDRLAGKREVVTAADVSAMIGLLGRPEDIFDAEGGEGDASGTPPEGSGTLRGSRRLYRDPDNAVLGGVCGGLGAYFNLDPVWFRIAFILLALAYGSSILVYLVMWLIIPEARSTVQRLEMRGEPVNLNNISKNINREFTKVKDNIRNIPESEGYRRSRNAIQQLFHVIGEIILLFLKIIVTIIGISFVLAGLIILVVIVSTFFFHFTQFFPHLVVGTSYYMPDILALFTRPENVPYIIGSLILTLGIPMLALVYGGIKIIFNIRTHNRIVGVTFFVIWLISAISLSLFIADIASNFAEKALITEMVPLEMNASDTLYVEVAPFAGDRIEEMISLDRNGIFRDRETGALLSRPELDIVLSGGTMPELEVYRRAHAKSRSLAIRRADSIYTGLKTDRNHILLDPLFRAGTIWYGQEVSYYLRVPAGTVICLDRELRQILDYYIPNEENLRGYNLAGKCWVMTEEGLEEVE